MAKKSRDRAKDGYDKAVNPTKYPKEGNANYDFARQVEPMNPMGHGSFANMPADAIFRSFSNKHNFRDGLVNSFTASLEELSDIPENRR